MGLRVYRRNRKFYCQYHRAIHEYVSYCLKCKILNDIDIGAAKWWVSLSGKIGAKLTNNKLPPAPQTINLVHGTMHGAHSQLKAPSNGFPIPGWISTGFSFLLFLLLPISASLLFIGEVELSSKVCSSFTWLFQCSFGPVTPPLVECG